MTQRVIQKDLFDPTHDVVYGGEGGAAAERHVLVAAVRIYEGQGTKGPDTSEQEDMAFWAHWELNGDHQNDDNQEEDSSWRTVLEEAGRRASGI